jgi:translation initiation factor 2B subunit (eIF-2B alpha/beta/delta family)/8-oxo-dGTP pyrophosphatase MutT (NUDIX family)
MQLIQRVTTTFLVKTGVGSSTASSSLRIAIFQRASTMPTFPSKWAAVSGSIEEGETPWETAQRELQEETNWQPTINTDTAGQGVRVIAEPSSTGLFLDVEYTSPRSQTKRTIRVYPFVMHVAPDFELSLKGTEHDRYDWVTIGQLEKLDEQKQTVPLLAQAFHHATVGKFCSQVSQDERQWALDKQNGASVMSRRALDLIKTSGTDAALVANRLRMLRPSMVSIVKAMGSVIQILSWNRDDDVRQNPVCSIEAATQVAEALNKEAKQSVQVAVAQLLQLQKERNHPLKVCTFSRSSIVVSVIKGLLDESPDSLKVPILCSESVPGAEGRLMTIDLNSGSEGSEIAMCVADERIKEMIRTGYGDIDVLLIGADCILAERSAIVNKIGTTELASAAFENMAEFRCQVYCCTDQFKLWDDIFPPPLETDLFETVPSKYIDRLLLPP